MRDALQTSARPVGSYHLSMIEESYLLKCQGYGRAVFDRLHQRVLRAT
jgi:hypothetical protein